MSPKMWLIVAELHDPLAREVTRALRTEGERAVLIDSAEMVRAYARDDIPCILILPPNKTILPDALTAAFSIAFAAHIPIVIGKEPAIPAEPWMSAAIDGTQQSEDIVAQLRAAWDAVATRSVEAKQAHMQAYGLTLPPPPAITTSEIKEQRRQRTTKRLRTFQLVMLIPLVALLIFSFITQKNIHYTPSTFPAGQTFFARVPGPCSSTKGFWSWYHQDSYTCQSDGLLMTRTDFSYLSNMDLFVYTGTKAGYFQSSYAVQVTGAFPSHTDTTTCIGLAVHEQFGGGQQIFYACEEGAWFINRFDTDGIFNKRLGIGTLSSPQSTYTLRVDVHDTTMTFWVNGIAIDTIDDPTYTTTEEVGLVLVDETTPQNPEEALFSNFSITPYGDAEPDDAQLQALAADQQVIASPYEAPVPGDGCDRGDGGWSHVYDENDPSLVSFSCQPTGFIMIPPNDASTVLEDYYNRLGVYPQSYRVATTIAFSKKSAICAGISTASQMEWPRVFVVCSNMAWRVYSLVNGSDISDISGTIPKASVYHLTVTLESGIETMTLNGVTIHPTLTALEPNDDTITVSLADTTLPSTGNAGTAAFSDFSFTPLP